MKSSNIVKFCLLLIGKSQSVEIINSYANRLTVVWNVPTFQCRSHGFHFEDTLNTHGISVNERDVFKGDKMTILYDPGSFPAIFNMQERDEDIFLRNGGVPQDGNIEEHLTLFEERVSYDIPHENYSGLAVIDFESWRPIFRQNWAKLEPYKDLSQKIELNLHPDWNRTQIERESRRRFEKSGRKFVQETLQLAKRLRPNATWGYYAYPYCFNMQSGEKNPFCDMQVMEENDQLKWMFEAGDSLHPSLYMSEKGYSSEERVQLIEGRIYETLRVNGNLSRRKRIFPYFWYNYRDTRQFLSKNDLDESLKTLKSFGVDGIIMWGSSKDVNTGGKCEKLYDYVENILGPSVLNLF